MTGITVDVLGIEELGVLLNKFYVTFSDSKKMHKGALKAFYLIEEKLFESGGNGSWQPLTAKYSNWKRNNYGSMPVMQLTGSLKASLTGKNNKLRVVDKGDGVDLVMDSSYWHNHQYGTTVPQRKTVMLTDEDRELILSYMLRATLGGRLSKLFSRG